MKLCPTPLSFLQNLATGVITHATCGCGECVIGDLWAALRSLEAEKLSKVIAEGNG